MNFQRQTIVVESKLAYRTQRLGAASEGVHGIEVLTLPLLAARLAGGFCRPADDTLLVASIGRALDLGGFEEFEEARVRPGMARAVLSTLGRVWAAGVDLSASPGPRMRDLLLIETRIREDLPTGVLLPVDLVNAALSRVQHATALIGRLHLHRIPDVDANWRPLLSALSAEIDVTWEVAGFRDRSWFQGKITTLPTPEPQNILCEVCADPRSEIVEALRWARNLLSSGSVRASEIGMVAADTGTWDDHMLVLAMDAELPVHFAGGVSALSTQAGQACAALGDALMNGLSIDRVRRIGRLSPYLKENLPANWATFLPADASMLEVKQWEAALGSPAIESIAAILLPAIRILSAGPSAAEKAAGLLLNGKSLGLWREALRLAPPAAIEITLGSLRISDERDPGNSIVWASASQMVGAPRPFMRLVGLSSGSWPRMNVEDPLLPDHLVDKRKLTPFPRVEKDRLAFQVLVGHPGAQITVSRSRRSASGSFLARSALCTSAFVEVPRLRTRVPEHAFSEGDRLLARPEDATLIPRFSSASQCWINWSSGTKVTAHDGMLRRDHPTIERAIGRVQSATALRQLLRDPLGFVWQRALGMRAPELDLQPLRLDAATFGELVHELLRFAVDTLEPQPGLVHASLNEIDDALDRATASVKDRWPLLKAVPPRVLWHDTLAEARRRAYRGLTLDKRFGQGTRSWSEIPFGENESASASPWSPQQEVIVGASGLRLRGRIDRIDVKPDGRAVRISDYKTGRPYSEGEVVIAGGAEIQRALYATAIRQLMPDVADIISRLVFLDSVEIPFELRDEELDQAEKTVAGFIDVAVALLRAGAAHPGPDAYSPFNDYKLALPANLDGYRNRKSEDFNERQSALVALWSRP